MYFSLLLTRLFLALTRPPQRRDDRGDVPGWVMITVLTIGLAAAVFAIAKPQLEQMLRGALNQVK